MGEYCMQRTYIAVVNALAAGLVLLGMASAASAQDQPAPATPAAKPKTATPAKPATSATKPKTATGTKAAAPLTLKTEKEKFSYALGMNLGAGLHKQGIQVDSAILARGIRDAAAGGKTLLTEDEARAALKAKQEEMMKEQQAKMQAAGAVNKKEGEEFLAANKGKEGVVTTPSGLQYKVLTQGTGPKPTPADTVVCNYRGTLINGTEFDSSYKRNEPATFPVGGVIKGWTEALQLMPVGS
jgi:FKBP-type peptidyl-prolyl cis-trans isomerase FklB